MQSSIKDAVCSSVTEKRARKRAHGGGCECEFEGVYVCGEASKLPRKVSSRKDRRVVVKVSTVCKEVRGTPLFLRFFFGYG